MTGDKIREDLCRPDVWRRRLSTAGMQLWFDPISIRAVGFDLSASSLSLWVDDLFVQVEFYYILGRKRNFFLDLVVTNTIMNFFTILNGS